MQSRELVLVTLVAWQSKRWASRELRDRGLSTGGPVVTAVSGKVLRGTGSEVREVERLWVQISHCTGGGWGVVGSGPGSLAGIVDNWEGWT